MDLLITSIYVFIGVLGVQGKLKITARRTLSLGHARIFGVGYLLLALSFEIANSQSDTRLQAVASWTSGIAKGAADVRTGIWLIAIGSGFALLGVALKLSHPMNLAQNVERSGDPTLASRFSRSLCALVDSVIYFAPVVVVSSVAALVDHTTVRISVEPRERLIWVAELASLAVYTLQCWLVSTRGQSLAKGWFHLRIVGLDGKPPGFRRGVVLRSWVFWGVFAVPPLRPLGLLLQVLDIFCFLASPDARSLHDQVAGTRVILASSAASSL